MDGTGPWGRMLFGTEVHSVCWPKQIRSSCRRFSFCSADETAVDVRSEDTTGSSLFFAVTDQ